MKCLARWKLWMFEMKRTQSHNLHNAVNPLTPNIMQCDVQNTNTYRWWPFNSLCMQFSFKIWTPTHHIRHL